MQCISGYNKIKLINMVKLSSNISNIDNFKSIIDIAMNDYVQVFKRE